MNLSDFYGNVRANFGSLTQKQVDGFETLLAATDGLTVEQRAYLLATAWHETARTMQPLKETERAGVSRTDAQVVSALDNAFRRGQLTWVKTPYWRFDDSGKAWFGRGYVQLTHKTNYAKAGAKLGVDLLGNPDLALQPTVAARVLVRGCLEGWFTGKTLDDYLPDYKEARRVVNGTDRAAEIAQHAKRFEAALYGAGAAETPVEAAPVVIPLPVAPAKPKSLWDRLWGR